MHVTPAARLSLSLTFFSLFSSVRMKNTLCACRIYLRVHYPRAYQQQQNILMYIHKYMNICLYSLIFSICENGNLCDNGIKLLQ